MKVKVLGKGEICLEEGSSIENILESFNLHKGMVIVLKDSVPVPIDLPLKDGDSIEIVNVVSGG